MTSVKSVETFSGNDVNIGTLNLRIDARTKNVQISTTGQTANFVYSVKISMPKSNSVTHGSGFLSNVSTTPTDLFESVLDTVNNSAEVNITNLTYFDTHFATIVCTNESEPHYFVSILKTD